MAGSQIQFSVEDLRTPEGIERTLRLFQSSLNTLSGTPGSAQSTANLGDLVSRLAPLIRNQLQAPGIAPLNLQSLLPNSGSAVLLEDTHANRLALYPAGNYAVGTVFYETDRTVVYAIVNVTGTLVWQYIAGMYTASFASRPTDLGTYDAGFLYLCTENVHVCEWRGTLWFITDGGGGYFVDSAAALGAGWSVCDGTATNYLVVSGADLAQTAFTTPDEVTAPSGVYHKSIAAYTGVINAAAAGAITGSTANTTATNNANTTGITVAAHPDHIHDDATANATPHLFGVDLVTGTSARTGGVLDVAGAPLTLTHAVTDPGHNHTQNAHLHAAGTLAVDATGQPRNMGVLRYFRR